MADENDAAEKTEDPTQKRLDDAHDRGDVAKSQEVNTWFMIAGATLVLSTFSGSIGGGIMMPLRNLLANSWMIHADGPGLLALSRSLGIAMIAALGVPLLLLMIAAVAGNLMQHRLVWSGETLKPKLSKISPLAGAKRIFGKQAAANFAKGIFKVAALGAVMTAILWPERHRLDAMVRFDPAAILGATTTLTLQLLGAVVALLALVAIADYFFQYRQWFERQKMSLREIKEEFKQSEGDPHIKARIRQLRHARMKKRMMAAVPKASVIITNPTHYAVALSYDRGMPAPVCVAKGVDSIALKIREVAKAHDIPIIENVALARALHATVEIDDEIPVEHYHAVAEIIGYVMGLKRGLSGRRV
ncbi:MAG: flagellar biosynthesis protein FlhB [Thermoanaerobaculia bacterium]|jgi:flagellar biosynthetic protein FlhB|nr:flagellar biosynthesis protein FlhB [Thermoanaerobaculia bacterium]